MNGLVDIKIDLKDMAKLSNNLKFLRDDYLELMRKEYTYAHNDPYFDRYIRKTWPDTYKPESFWSKFYLFKHKADEEDEEGESIYVYSIVRKSDWDCGRKSIDQFQDYMVWARNLAPALFEEVAANWFEMIGSEDDFNDFIKQNEIQIVT